MVIGCPRALPLAPHAYDPMMDSSATTLTELEPRAIAASQATQRQSDQWRLVSLSLLMFFTELALIRWTAANNVHLAYITNFILLASFLGIGVGFLLAASRHDVFRWTPLALAALNNPVVSA